MVADWTRGAGRNLLLPSRISNSGLKVSGLCCALSYSIVHASQAAVGQYTGNLRRQAVKYTDGRVRLISEILTCMKLIKMYAWENAFAQAVQRLRAHERQVLQRSGFLQVHTFSNVKAGCLS